MKSILTAFLIFACVCAATAQNGTSSSDIVVNPLPFNSGDDDFAPFYLQNGKLLYFTSDRDGEQRVFLVQRTASGWGDPQMLSDIINEGDQVGAAAFTPDGQYMVFSAYGRPGSSMGRTDLYSARKVNGQWSEVRNLGPDINSPFWDSQPFISGDGNTLYFASDRPGGSGGSDIYMCRRTDKGWSAATNLGLNINTAADEMSPSIAADNERLYFASNRVDGLGGFDIYMIDLPKTTTKAPVKNVGAPVNSDADEYFYFSLPNANQAYFSSSRDGGSLDIYSAVPDPAPGKPVLIVHGVVKNVLTNQPLGSLITITDLNTATKIGEFQSDDETGEYFVTLAAGREYSVTASKEGYLFYSERFETPPNESGREIIYDIPLSPIENGHVRLLVFFDFDKAELQPESRAELDRVSEFLKSNPSISINIEGHTDDQGTAEYNKTLSENRAESVKRYLIAGGVPASRITSQGFGKTRPLMQGTTEEARAKNRRVEMRITR